MRPPTAAPLNSHGVDTTADGEPARATTTTNTANASDARTLTGISSMATRRLLADMALAWREHSGRDLRFESTGGVDAAKRVRDGEAFDLVVLASDAIAQLVATGRIVAASVVDLARSGVAIAVPHGAPRPRVDAEGSLLAALRAAPRIGYSTGPSGTALLQLFARWNIGSEIADRLVLAPAGVPVGALLARGEVSLGFQQLSELMHVEGIDLLGPMPPGCEIVTTFSGGVGADSADPAGARDVLEFGRSPASENWKRRQGMEPA